MYSVQTILGIAYILIRSAMEVMDYFEIEAPLVKRFLWALGIVVAISKIVIKD